MSADEMPDMQHAGFSPAVLELLLHLDGLTGRLEEAVMDLEHSLDGPQPEQPPLSKEPR